MSRACLEDAPLVRMPEDVAARARQAVAVAAELRERLGRQPSTEETAAAVEIRADQLVDAWCAMRQPASLDAPFDPSGQALGETLLDPGPTPEEMVLEQTEWAELRRLIDELPRRDREAVRLRRLAEQEGVAERVHLLGGVERRRVPELMRSADVVVSVPWYEPFGMVAVEAMACGVPVVASAVGGQVDTVVDGVTGIHVPPRRPDEVARALNALLTDARMRKRMGTAGAERARNRYSWDFVAELTLDAYSLVTEREPRAAQAWRRR
jgi:hypothetical protein